MRYIEKVSNAGVLLKVDRMGGYYTAYLQNKPILNMRLKKETTLHALQRVIFVGSLFKQSFFSATDIGFFYVSKRQIIIPFKTVDSSDVRHIKLPAHFNFDVLPASVSYFKNLNIGSYANALRTGVQYFILEPRFGRELIADLKYSFPLSRVIIYRDNKALLNVLDEEKESRLYGEEDEMDFELIEKDEILLLSKDILFSARIFISKQQWEALLAIPFKLPISSVECQLIAFYVKIEIHLKESQEFEESLESKKKDNDNVVLELKKINRLYEALDHFLSVQEEKVNSYFDKTFIDTELIHQVERVIGLKKRNLDYALEKDQQERSFYDYVLLKLKEKKIKIEMSYS